MCFIIIHNIHFPPSVQKHLHKNSKQTPAFVMFNKNWSEVTQSDLNVSSE